MLVAAQLCSRADRGLAFARSRLLTAALGGQRWVDRSRDGRGVTESRILRSGDARVKDSYIAPQWQPDGMGSKSDDCVMAQWFLEHNLSRLWSTDQAVQPKMWRPGWLRPERVPV